MAETEDCCFAGEKVGPRGAFPLVDEGEPCAMGTSCLTLLLRLPPAVPSRAPSLPVTSSDALDICFGRLVGGDERSAGRVLQGESDFEGFGSCFVRLCEAPEVLPLADGYDTCIVRPGEYIAEVLEDR